MDAVKPVADFGTQIAGSIAAMSSQLGLAGPQLDPAQRCEEQKKQLARDFESVLLTKLFDQVKESIGQASFDEEDSGASEQVHGLFWLYLAQDIANKGGFGMWQEIYQHLSDMEGAHTAGLLMNREL
jgi:Rod binding domain-containing protein